MINKLSTHVWDNELDYNTYLLLLIEQIFHLVFFFFSVVLFLFCKSVCSGFNPGSCTLWRLQTIFSIHAIVSGNNYIASVGHYWGVFGPSTLVSMLMQFELFM